MPRYITLFLNYSRSRSVQSLLARLPSQIHFGVRTYTSSSSSTIQITETALSRGSIATLALNRPQARNAISLQLLSELTDYVHRLKIKDTSVENVRCLIVSSTSDTAFCAGADLKERKTFSPSETNQFLTTLNNTLSTLSSLEIPTIAAIQGSAFGGGVELALSTDFRVLSDSAELALTETRLAIVPGAGGTYRLPKLIGYTRALDMILTGRRVGATEALNFGLANRVAAKADEEALNLAKQICEGGPIAIRAAKQAVRGASPEWEQVAHSKVVNSRDKFEALDAFANKRKPLFKGE